MKYDPLSHMDERVWKEEGRGNVKDPIVGSGWILTKEVKLWLTKHVKRSRSPGDGGRRTRALIKCYISWLFFPVWRSQSFGLHLLTLERCRWQEQGSQGAEQLEVGQLDLFLFFSQ